MSRYQPANQGGFNDQSGYRDAPDTGYGDNAYSNNNNSYGNNRGDGYHMSSENPYATSGYKAPKKHRSKWLTIGLPILLVAIIVGAVVGGVVGSRKSNDNNSDPNTGSSNASGDTNNAADASGTGAPNTAGAGVGSTATGANGQAYLAVNTDSYMLPVYATGTATSGYSAPTTLPSAKAAWPSDPFPPSNDSIRAHPRLGAPAYKWEALNSGLIENDPYFKEWNETIIGNASATLNDDPLPYTEDGGLTGSGVLDVAREMKVRVKNWAYAYKITNDTAYANRVFLELRTAAGNNSDVPFGANDNTRWNPAHFLDVAEFTSMFAIGYDWLYDFWTDEQRDQIMWSLITNGLSHGLAALTNDPSASSYVWWTGEFGNAKVDGNWNCVINGGLTMGALAIIDRDPTNTASQLLALTVPNAQANCFTAAQPDGSWAETANYWYFGTTGAAEMVSSLITAYGDDRGLSMSNPGWRDVSLYHIYVQGMTSLFNYGDHGPNKYSATANSLMLWSDVFDEPRYALYQRDHYDASEPWSMFWYDPSVSGTWWDGLALDKHFNSPNDDWATGRSSWSENSGTYWAMKAGQLQGHQTHGNLDVGDFVLDAMGQRWAGELGSGQYLADGYFANENQDSSRWLWYRTRTEGQNTILVGGANQLVSAAPSSNFDSSGTAQGAAPSFNVSQDDTAFFTTDMTSAYQNVGSLKRGIRFLNARRQFLVQDDYSDVTEDLQWRMHTNATDIAINTEGTTATLSLGGQTMDVILKSPSGAKFETLQPVRLSTDPALPSGEINQDQPNPGVTVLAVTITGGGSGTMEVLFNPKWPSFADSDFVSPPTVALDSWSLTSHN